MIRLVEVVESETQSFTLHEVWINEEYVVKVEAAPAYTRFLAEGRLPPDLGTTHQFSRVTLSEGQRSAVHVVVGDVGTIASKVDKRPSPELLMG
jgi:hypothetical protein